MKEPRAIIFDFDGVIVDTERLHFEAFRRVLAEEGVSLTWEDYTRIYLAMDDKGCFSMALDRHCRQVTPEVLETLIRRKARYFSHSVSDSVVLFPGVADFIRQAAERYPLAIASGALRDEIEFLLGKASLRAFFQVVVAAEDVRKGKPDPEAYITALTRLNRLRSGRPLRPPECLVIEDSFHGVAAARAAGMRCLAVANSYTAEELIAADLVVKTLEEADWMAIEAIFH